MLITKKLQMLLYKYIHDYIYIYPNKFIYDIIFYQFSDLPLQIVNFLDLHMMHTFCRTVQHSCSHRPSGWGWIVGDFGNPLKEYLMTPINNPRNGHEEKYNRLSDNKYD